MKIHYILGMSLIMVALSCSGYKHHSKDGSGSTTTGQTKGDDDTKTGSVDGDNTGGGTSSDLQLVDPTGSAMSFVDSKGLTTIYSRVFTKGASGFVHCATSKPIDYRACEDMFSPDETGTLGSFLLYNPALNRGDQNVNRVTSVSLNYMRSLRAGLSRECNNLVTSELKTLKAGQGATNLLIKAEAPTAAVIDSFFRKILGIEGAPTISLNFDAAGYAADFPKSMALMPDPAKAQQSAYLNLCIAVAMDPQVFLY